MTITATAAADLFRREPNEYIDAGVGEVAYRRIGSGPDVLFVHGWPVSSATFRALLPYLTDHLTCHLIDLPGAGSSRYADDTPLSIRNHIRSVRTVVDHLQLDQIAVVGHDSGGLIARHALAGDPRLRALGLIDTEQIGRPSWRFRAFLAGRHIPGYGAGLGWVAGRPRLRRNPLVLGGAFTNRDLLDGEFDEFFLGPLRQSSKHRRATTQLLRTFSYQLIRELPELHRKIDVPVQLVWGQDDRFFPVTAALEMVSSFPNADLAVIANAALFAHEERPDEVASALLPVLVGHVVTGT